MIDRGPYDWKSEGDVDSFVEGKGLDGDESLVVVHADIGIDFPSPGFGESGVGGRGPVRSQPWSLIFWMAGRMIFSSSLFPKSPFSPA